MRALCGDRCEVSRAAGVITVHYLPALLREKLRHRVEEALSGQAPAEQGNPFPTPIPHPLALFDLSLLHFPPFRPQLQEPSHPLHLSSTR